MIVRSTGFNLQNDETDVWNECARHYQPYVQVKFAMLMGH